MNFRYDENGVPVKARELVTDFLLTLVIVVVILATTGCVALPNAEQIKAEASDRNVTVICATATGVWGTTRVVKVQVDKAAIAGGAVGVTPDCQVSSTVEQKGVRP